MSRFVPDVQKTSVANRNPSQLLTMLVTQMDKVELRKELVAELTARTTGELFLYMNDAVIGLLGIADSFYVGRGKASRNVGTAKIKGEAVTSIGSHAVASRCLANEVWSICRWILAALGECTPDSAVAK